MAQITLKNFKGITLDESKWKDAYGGFVVGLDVYGLANNSNKVSYPGVPQGIFQISAGAEAGGVSSVTELITGLAAFSDTAGSTTAKDYAIGSANPGRVYRRDSSTWTWLSAVSTENTTSPTGNLQTYALNLYYTSRSYLGRYTQAGASSSQFQSFNNGTTNTARPMKVFAGSLFVGEAQNVAKYDGTTFTATALVLPSDFIIQGMEIYAGYLYISANNSIGSRVFVWDGISNTYQSFIEIFGEATAPKLQAAGGILWAIGNKTIYSFNGSNFEKVISLPFGRGDTSGQTEYAGSLAFASSNTASSALYEDGTGGVWLMAKNTTTGQWYPVLLLPIRGNLTQMTVGAISPGVGSNLYVGVSDIANSLFEIHELQGNNANATNIWQSLPIDAGSTNKKVWHGIELNIDALATGQSVIIKYRLDDTSSFTTLKTFSSGTATTFVPLGRTSRTITLRVELTASSSNTTRLHALTLDYTPTKV